jgi:hypothetical protein
MSYELWAMGYESKTARRADGKRENSALAESP